MKHLSSLSQRIADLVHPHVRASRLERLHHECFARARLPVPLAAAVGLPAYLAFGGVPGLAVVLALACLMTPLASIAILSRSGSLRLAQSVWLLGLFGFASVLVAGLGLSPGTASALLLLAPLEAYLAGDLVLLAIAAGAAGAFTLAVAFMHPLVAATPRMLAHAGALEATLVTIALAYAAGLMIQSLRLRRLERDAARATQAPRDALDLAIGDLVLHHDRSGAVIHVGGAGAGDFGIGPRDLAGRGFFERVHVADRPIFLKALSDATREGGTQTACLRLRGGSVASQHGAFDAPVFHRVEWRGRRLEGETDAHGIALVALVRDIGEAAQAPTPAAEAADAWQDRFLATVSHELRTPLNAIIGFSEMLAHPDLTPKDPAKAREYAQIIHTSGQHLLSVVNTILDASKLESGRFEVQPESFDVAPLVQSCCDMMSLKAEQAGIALDVAIAPQVRDLVADRRACKQILINLLSNAVKFTPSGGRIRVAASLEGQNIAFAVSDTGIGIGAPDLPRLGDAFFQARNDYARPFEGTGLGLSVVRGLVGLHGGTISIESAQGEGTLVTVRLPRDGRPAAGRTSGSARIETIARRREAERAAAQDLVSQNLVSPVKKIA